MKFKFDVANINIDKAHQYIMAVAETEYVVDRHFPYLFVDAYRGPLATSDFLDIPYIYDVKDVFNIGKVYGFNIKTKSIQPSRFGLYFSIIKRRKSNKIKFCNISMVDNWKVGRSYRIIDESSNNYYDMAYNYAIRLDKIYVAYVNKITNEEIDTLLRKKGYLTKDELMLEAL